MKSLLACLLALFACLPLAQADDLADAKALFDTLVEYQKSDDERLPDLFASDLSVYYLVTDGTRVLPQYLPRAEFHKMLKKELALKKGNKDVYEEVKFTPEGKGVRLDCTLLEDRTGKRGPCTMLFVKGDDGVWKIKELKVTYHQPAKPGEAKP